MKTSIRSLLGLLVIVGLVLGSLFVYQGLQPPAEAPMPLATFSEEDPDTIDDPQGASESHSTSSSDSESNESKESKSAKQIDGPSVSVSSIGLKAPLISTTAKPNGYLELPNPPDATWYQQTQPLGSDQGKTLIASHVDLGFGREAPFNRLHKIQKGALIDVVGLDGMEHTYKTSSLAIYPHNALPDSIFDVDGSPQLVLVTCSGPYLEIGDADYYEYNLVVTADPID